MFDVEILIDWLEEYNKNNYIALDGSFECDFYVGSITTIHDVLNKIKRLQAGE